MANLGTMTAWMSVLLNQQLDDMQIQTLLNKADLEETENWTWARLRSRMAINSFAAVFFPSITATQGSAVLTSNGAAFPAVTAQMAFRASGQFYVPISVVANPSPSQTLTLADPYPAAGGNISGTLFQLYYSAPGWQEIISASQQTSLRMMTQGDLDRVDPWLSQVSSPAQAVIAQGRDSADNAQFTLWPIETAANAYILWGQRGHVDMVLSSDLPAVPSAVIVAKAMAEASETLFTLREEAAWSNMRDYYQTIFARERDDARERDARQYGVISRVQDSYRGSAVGLDTIPFRDSDEWP